MQKMGKGERDASLIWFRQSPTSNSSLTSQQSNNLLLSVDASVQAINAQATFFWKFGQWIFMHELTLKALPKNNKTSWQQYYETLSPYIIYTLIHVFQEHKNNGLNMQIYLPSTKYLVRMHHEISVLIFFHQAHKADLHITQFAQINQIKWTPSAKGRTYSWSLQLVKYSYMGFLQSWSQTFAD